MGHTWPDDCSQRVHINSFSIHFKIARQATPTSLSGTPRAQSFYSNFRMRTSPSQVWHVPRHFILDDLITAITVQLVKRSYATLSTLRLFPLC